jgi:periplasmic protein TonB
MYADRYHSTASRPAGAGAALLISGAMILGLYYAGPTIAPGAFADPPITTTHIPLDPPPPKPQPEPQTEQRKAIATTPRPHIPDLVVDPPTDGEGIAGTRLIEPITSGPSGPVGPAGGGITADPPLAPVLVGAAVDPRYADALQPPYPPAEIRRGIEGSVTARVLIGVDGRVKTIEILKSPSDGLADATRRQALTRWRFKPATRDGIPVEGWKLMTLRFQIVE